MASNSSAMMGASTTGRSSIPRPTTADLLRAPALIQKRADPKARIKNGYFVERSDPFHNESETSGTGHKTRFSVIDKAPGVNSIQDDGESRSPRNFKAKNALLLKYTSTCELIKARLGVIQSNQQKLLQQSADMYGELSVHNELDLGVQDSLQDVVRLVSEDTAASRTVVDIVQSAIDVQGAWLTLMANAGHVSVEQSHIQQLEKIVNEQDKLIAAQKTWIQTMKNATDIRSRVSLPRDPQQRWRWIQMHIKFGAFGQAQEAVRKRIQQIFFHRVKNIRRLKALKLAASCLNFQGGA